MPRLGGTLVRTGQRSLSHATADPEAIVAVLVARRKTENPLFPAGSDEADGAQTALFLGFRSSERTRANLSERPTLPFLPRLLPARGHRLPTSSVLERRSIVCGPRAARKAACPSWLTAAPPLGSSSTPARYRRSGAQLRAAPRRVGPARRAGGAPSSSRRRRCGPL
jgi:hypothetical protein